MSPDERLNRTQEVVGSIPISSTTFRITQRRCGDRDFAHTHSDEYLHGFARRAGAAPVSPPAGETTHQLRGDDQFSCAVLPAVPDRFASRRLHVGAYRNDCRPVCRQHLDSKTLA